MEAMKFLLDTSQTCVYLPPRSARNVFLHPDSEDPAASYDLLIRHGFRRSGTHVYRPHCDQCEECIALRIEAAGFSPGRGQRRIRARNRDLRVAEIPAVFNPAHYALYQKYQNARHPGGSMADASEQEYRNFLGRGWADTRFYEITLKTRVVGVAVIDHTADGLSCVYTFYDPELEKRSLGNYAILWALEYALQCGKRYVYLGYWIKSCRKMAYKINFRPAEGFINGRWHLIDQH